MAVARFFVVGFLLTSCGGETGDAPPTTVTASTEETSYSPETDGNTTADLAPILGNLAITSGSEVVASLPTYFGAHLEATGDTETARKQLGTLAITPASLALTSTAVSSNIVSGFFKLECHWADPNQVAGSFCPDNIKSRLKGLSSDQLYDTGFKLTDYTLIGVLVHATQFLEDFYKRSHPVGSDSFQEVQEISGYSYLSTTGQGKIADTSGNPDKYSLKLPHFFNRLETRQDQGRTVQTLFRDPNGEDTRLGKVIYEKHGEFTGGGASSVTHSLTETYMVYSDDKSKARILANNHVGLADDPDDFDFSRRTVLMQNFESNRFIAKFASGSKDPNRHTQLVAVGTGGMNMQTGELISSYYAVAAQQGSQPEYKRCVHNLTQSEADDSLCATELKLWDGNFDVANYLGLQPQEASDLTEFVGFLNNGSYITKEQVPAEAGDTAQHMPDTIRVVTP